MTEALRDPLWQFIGVVLTVLVTVVTVLVIPRKRLSYYIVTQSSVVTVRGEIGSRLRILFDEKPVGKINLFVISILNHGNVPISKDDFVFPLEILFGSKGTILAADVTDVSPANLKPVTHVFS